MGDSVLQMIFKTGSGKSFRLTLDDPKEGVSPLEIQTAMNLVISKGIFDVEGGVTEISGANIVTTDTQPIEFA